MKREIDPKLLWGGALVVTLLIGSAALTYLNTRRIQEDATRVAHTHEVLEALGAVRSTATDAETGHRGFVITGQERYLEP